MIHPPRPGRRIVPKGKYARALGAKAALSSLAYSLFCIGVLGLLIACLSIGLLLFQPTIATIPLIVVFVGIVGSCSGLLIHIGVRLVKESKAIEPGVPLTRANTGHLPAPDSLVRASKEPVQEQQAVLLRAATASQETPPEQLVRPTAESQ